MFKTHRTFPLANGIYAKTIAVVCSENSAIILYHKTVVATMDKEKVTINDGGYDTVSTRIVINRALELLGLNKVYLIREKGTTKLITPKYKGDFEGRAVFQLNRKDY